MESSNKGEVWGGMGWLVFSGCKRGVWCRVVESSFGTSLVVDFPLWWVMVEGKFLEG